MQYGYARVSADGQDTQLQLVALRRAGVRKVVEEKRSGVATRPVLEALLLRLRPGDLLVVYKVDRLARSLADLLRIIRQVQQCGAVFKSLTEPIDTGTPLGVLTLQLLGSFAEFERSMIRERCIAGMNAARARGVVWGARRKCSANQVAEMVELGLSLAEIASRLGVAKTTAQRAWREFQGLSR